MKISESQIVDIIAASAPWLTPLPSAALVARASVRRLDWSIGEGIIAALIIETLGITSVATVLAFRAYNQSKRKTDPTAPTTLASILIFVYLISVISLTVFMDTIPELVQYAPIIFPLLTLVGAANIAMRNDHRKRLNAIADDKQMRRVARIQQAQMLQAAPIVLYRCKQCEATFKTKHKLAAHTRWTHPQLPARAGDGDAAASGTAGGAT